MITYVIPPVITCVITYTLHVTAKKVIPMPIRAVLSSPPLIGLQSPDQGLNYKI